MAFQKYPEGTILLVLKDYPTSDNNIIRKGNKLLLTYSKQYPDSYSLEGNRNDCGWVPSFIENTDNFKPIKFNW